MPQQWIFEDEGYSGATLERPGLEQVRDLAAAGDIQVVLVHSPDRLSRKYAYQVLLIEEFGRHGVETRFLNGPSNATAEDQLLVQFQGMIAEYERAQILERSRRGKRHRARAGEISVLGGAPYGYRYVRKREDNPAAYVIIDAEARVVRDVYEHYIVTGWSIAAITRWLNEQGVPTRKVGTRWERSTVWAMLRNPAYRGTACFGKTRRARRQRVTRPLRLRGGVASRDSASHERPREEWIEIPVPAIVDESTFARAQELLHENKVHARRRTIEPSLVQGLVSCQKCGYALSRASGRSSARRIHYYRCIGSDGWRHLGGPRCDTRPVRQDLTPRTRGDVPATPETEGGRSGVSPNTRGRAVKPDGQRCTRPSAHHAAERGVAPARAGIHRAQWRVHQKTRRVPRARGDGPWKPLPEKAISHRKQKASRTFDFSKTFAPPRKSRSWSPTSTCRKFFQLRRRRRRNRRSLLIAPPARSCFRSGVRGPFPQSHRLRQAKAAFMP